MPYFSFDPPKDKDEVHPVAIVNGGYYDGSLLYKHEGENSKAKAIKLPPDSSFAVLPSPKKDKREVFYVCGASGSGKSYQARGIAEKYKKLFGDREIYLVSKLPYDDTLDTMKIGKPKRIRPESLVTSPIDGENLAELKNSLIIFDDYDTFEGDIGKAVHALIDCIATLGRHQNISMMCLSHHLSNYKKSRLILNESSHLIVYPQATSHSGLKRLLDNQVGMTGDDVKALKNKGRWIMISKNYPQYMIAEHEAKFLHQD